MAKVGRPYRSSAGKFVDGIFNKKCMACSGTITIEDIMFTGGCYIAYHRKCYLEQENLKQKERYRDDPAKREKIRNYLLKINFGITLEQYNEILVKQDHKCAMCKEENENQHAFHVDHDHITNKIRGLLCHHCNLLLGNCKEKIERLEAAIDYIIRYKDMEKEFGQVNEFNVEGYIQGTQG